MSRPLLQPGMRYSFLYRSQPEEIPGKGWSVPQFTSSAFRSQIGKVVPLTWEGRQFGHGRLIAADVSDDGYSIRFTYEVTDLDPGQPGDISTRD